MSLIRLLSASPSLIPLSGEPRKYRAARQGMLPIFGSPSVKNAPVEAPARTTELSQRGALAQARALSRAPGVIAARPPGQAEMKLENVRVLRNDLQDADVEWELSEMESGGGFVRKAGNLWRRMMRRASGAPA